MAGNTANRAYTYPQLSDAANVPFYMQQLATQIDTDVNTVDNLHKSYFAKRTSNSTAVNNSTALVSDSQLLVTPAISQVFTLDGLIMFTSGTTPDFKMAFSFPAGATLSWAGAGVDVTGSSGSGDMVGNAAARLAADSTFAYGGGAAFVCSIHLKGLFIMGSTAGNLTLRWAQFVANASNTIVLQDSWIRVRRES